MRQCTSSFGAFALDSHRHSQLVDGMSPAVRAIALAVSVIDIFLFLSLLQIISHSLSATEYQQLLADTYQNISYVGLSTIGSSTVKRMSMLTTIM